MNRKYRNLKIVVDKDNAEMVTGVVGYLLSPDGIEETLSETGHIIINVYMPYNEKMSDDYIKILIKNNLKSVTYEMEISTIDYDPATETEWKKYFKPQKIGKNIVIKPSWEEYLQKDEEVVVTIDPGAAFGTGLHETTRGVIVLLEEIIKDKKTHNDFNTIRLLDAGTGSGILAIVAYKMGIQNILAIDNDIEAVDTTKENLIANDIKSGVNAEHTTLEDLSDYRYYDIILANIIPEVLVPNKETLVKMLRGHNSDLILSGILEKEKELVISEFSKIEGLVLCKKEQIQEWTTLWFKLEKLDS
ncbi:MAG: 50S ribosomal protein L11 methyltransferase [bacterium]